jgi:hypothetical protein
MPNFKILCATIGLFMLLSSCAQSPVSVLSTETVEPITEVCPQRNPDNSSFQVSPIENSSLSQLRLEIENYLNSGGVATGLQSLILDIQNNTIGSIMEVDLNKDGVSEIVLSTTTSTKVDGHLSGWVGIYQCELGKYNASYTELGQFMGSVKVQSVEDALNLGTSQIFVEYEWGGWSCSIGMQILGQSSGKWSWVFGHYLNCPATVSVRTNSTPSRTEIVFQGKLHDSMGIEPDKDVIQIFSVKDGEFQLQP